MGFPAGDDDRLGGPIEVAQKAKIHDFEQRLGQRQIGRSAGVSQSTVHEYLARFQGAGLRWPLSEEWSEVRLEDALFPPGQTAAKLRRRTLPDFEGIRRQLQQHRDLSLELLWEEYRQHHPDGYCYSRFCRLYRRWRKQQDLVLRPVLGAGAVRLVPMQGGVDTVMSIVETVSV